MHLKRLELFGFKSFPDRVELEFGPGITAVVGPNGCGKTNIADSVRWVLGETRSRSLRAGSMAEVIFNGTEARKQLSIAEVTLVLEGDGPGGFGEIAVTRKVFRSGDSQYLINKVPCRLRDIVDLFADTGLGRPSYSFFEQGKIDAILASKPTERRAIFEEAAGITKYRLRREEALRKLAATEANLARVGDIVSEVRRQTISLARQAGKARRYKEYSDELRELELGLAASKWHSLGQRTDSLARALASAREEMARVSALQASVDSELEESRSAVLRGEEELAGLGRRRAEVALAAGKVEGEIKALEERSRALVASAEREETEVVALRRQAGRLATQAKDVESRTGELVAGAALAAEALKGAEAEAASLAAAIESKRADAEKLRSQLLEAASSRAGTANEKESRRAAAEGAASSAARLGARRDELARALKEAGGRLSDEEATLKKAASSCESLEKQAAKLDAARETAESALAEAASLVEKRATELSGAKASLDALVKLSEALEGYEAGAKALLAGKARPRGVLGAFADRFKVDAEHSAAVEAALGSKVQAVVLSGEDALEGTAAFLADKGRATMLIPGVGRVPETPNGARTVADCVSCDGETRPLVDALLRGVLYAESLKEALALSRRHGLPAVTPAGELVEPAGAVTAGGSVVDSSAAILRRKAAVQELGAKVKELGRSLDAARKARADAESKLAAAGEGLAGVRGERAEASVLAARAQERVRELEEACARLKREAQVVEEELGQIGLAGQESHRAAEELARAEGDLAARENALRESLQALGAELAGFEARRGELAGLLTECRVEAAELRERSRAAHAEVAALRVQAESALARAAEREAAAGSSRQTAATALEEAAALRDGLVTLAADEDSARRALADCERVLSEVRGRAAELESKSRKARVAHEETLEKVHAVELEGADAKAQLAALCDRIAERYGVELSRDAEGRQPLEDEEAAVGRAADLRDKLEKIGPVNMVAVEEHEELEKRYEFLSEQREDLFKAKAFLMKVIQEANKISRERFLATFEEISRNFEVIFERLFGGGKAYLQLVESDDVLESGVHIVARPPGKRPQSINLLSGGEKALTAIALLFAMFMVKPAPFCILDEIDAPLDESNVDRFTALLEELASRSQFVIITHNKRTMRKADVLYGVTMEEKGCSRVVSVKLAGEHEVLHDSEAGEPAVQNA